MPFVILMPSSPTPSVKVCPLSNIAIGDAHIELLISVVVDQDWNELQNCHQCHQCVCVSVSVCESVVDQDWNELQNCHQCHQCVFVLAQALCISESLRAFNHVMSPRFLNTMAMVSMCRVMWPSHATALLNQRSLQSPCARH